MAHTLPTLWQRLFDRAPSGYRPGVTLAHLQRNLGLAGCEVLGPGSARYALADGSLAFEVRERTESQLLMHLVLCEFRLQVPGPQQGTARLALQHTVHCGAAACAGASFVASGPGRRGWSRPWPTSRPCNRR